MYRNAVFRVKVKVFMRKLAFLKQNLHAVMMNIREAIKAKKVLKVQSSVREYLWQMRWKKIKEVATKSVTKISAYLKMRKERKNYL